MKEPAECNVLERDRKKLKSLIKIKNNPSAGLKRLNKQNNMVKIGGFTIFFLAVLLDHYIPELLKFFLILLSGGLIGFSVVQKKSINNLPFILNFIDWDKVQKILYKESPDKPDLK